MRFGDAENTPTPAITSPASGQTLVHYMVDTITPTPVDTPKDKPPYMETPTETPVSPLGALVGILGILGAGFLLRKD